MTISFNRGLMLAAIESTFNTAQALDPLLDAFEVITPEFTPEITSQRRNIAAPDLSPFESLVTRKIGRMTFSLEVKSNGNTTASVAPRIGRLLRACGFSETQINTAAECVFRTVADPNNTGDLVFYGGGATYTGGVYLKFKVEILSGGGSGVATAKITHPDEAAFTVGGLAAVDLDDTGAVVLTDASNITILDTDGNTICVITPDFQTANPATGDVYYVHVRPIGYLYKPLSNLIPSVTIDLQFPDDSGVSIRHRLTGARGTVSVNATVGEFPLFEFEFTGSYNDQVDEATLTGTFEDVDPVQVEYAALAIAQRYGSKFTHLCASQWTIDMANEIAIRDCINENEASEGAFMTARAPTISFDPEAVLAAEEPIWSYLESGLSTEFWVRHGIANGNIVLFHAPNQQITNLGYTDRNNIRCFQIDGTLARLNGDDELEILFT